MKEYKRDYPLFSLCGLNCGLCPRFQTEGESKCPGCGGEDFHIKHPACAVIACSRKHGSTEFCFQCAQFPCERYDRINNVDSFITYRNVSADMERAKGDLLKYEAELDEKVRILEYLIKNYNDGRRKGFYCLAVNLLQLNDLRDIINEINEKISVREISLKEKIEQILILFQTKASEAKIELKLRKQV